MKQYCKNSLVALLILGLVTTATPVTVSAKERTNSDLEVTTQKVTSVNDGYISTTLDENVPTINEEKFELNGASVDDVSYGRDLSVITDKYPSTRSQGGYGTCWAFSSIAMAEFDLVTNHSYTKSLDLSELQNAYYTYHSVTDPLGGTDGDLTDFYNTSKNYLELGGNTQLAAYSLINWMGATSEENISYEDASDTLTNKIEDKWAYAGDARLQNFYRLNIKTNPKTVKSCILKYGAVGISYYASTSSSMLKTVENPNCNPTKVDAYYCPEAYSTNHAVVIVGWDDDFSKDYFATKPKGDGAWLVRNSWSTTNASNVYGYFWISYYDKSIASAAYVYDMQKASVYNHNYQYDGTPWTGSIGSKKGANIFTVPLSTSAKSEDLKAVGVSNLYQAGVECTVQVYTDLSNPNNPTSGILQNTTKKTLNYTGFHTIPLSKAVNLAPGETYAVVVTYSKGGVEIECSLNLAGSVRYKPSVDPGESFYHNGSSWVDIATIQDAKNGYVGNLRIKAYTVNSTTTPGGAPTLKNVIQKSGTATSVTLSWDKNDKAEGYEIYRATSAEGKYTLEKKITGNTTVTYTKTGLTKSKAYYYKVRSFRKISGKMYYGSFVPVVAYTSPAAPTGLKATAQTETSITLSWTKGTGVSGYAVYSRTSEKEDWKRITTITNAATTTYTHTGLTTGKTYYYVIKAYRKAGTDIYSPISAVLTTSTALPKVKNLVQSAATVNSVSLKWTKQDQATSYEVWRATSEKGTYSKVYAGKNTYYVDKGRATGTKYYYKVRSVRVLGGATIYGSVSRITGITKPAKVTGLKSSAKTDSTIKLTWNKVSGAAGYVVSYKSTATGTVTWLKTIKDGATTSCDLTKLSPLTNYYFVVKAYTEEGTYKAYGELSDAVAVKMLPQRPTSFTQVGATNNKIQLKWGTAKGVAGYEVYGCKTENGTYTKLATITNPERDYYNHYDLDGGRTYFYKIRSYATVNGKKWYSPYVNLSANTSIGDVTTLSVSDVGTNSATFQWNSVENAQYYDVYVKAEGDSEFTLKTTVAQSSEKCATLDNLSAGTTYEVYVIAYRTNGTYKACGKKSDIKTFTTQ